MVLLRLEKGNLEAEENSKPIETNFQTG